MIVTKYREPWTGGNPLLHDEAWEENRGRSGQERADIEYLWPPSIGSGSRRFLGARPGSSTRFRWHPRFHQLGRFSSSVSGICFYLFSFDNKNIFFYTKKKKKRKKVFFLSLNIKVWLEVEPQKERKFQENCKITDCRVKIFAQEVKTLVFFRSKTIF